MNNKLTRMALDLITTNAVNMMSLIYRRQSSSSVEPYKCHYGEELMQSSIDIDLTKNERIVSLTMISQQDHLQGFQLATVDDYGNHDSMLAGFDTNGANMITFAHNSDTTYQVRMSGQEGGGVLLVATVIAFDRLDGNAHMAPFACFALALCTVKKYCLGYLLPIELLTNHVALITPFPY